MTENVPRMMTVRQVARTGLLSEHALRLMLKAGKLPAIFVGNKALITYDRLCEQLSTLRWSSFFVTLTRKSFDIIMPAFFFQMVSYIHLMNVGGYDCNTHIHNP